MVVLIKFISLLIMARSKFISLRAIRDALTPSIISSKTAFRDLFEGLYPRVSQNFPDVLSKVHSDIHNISPTLKIFSKPEVYPYERTVPVKSKFSTVIEGFVSRTDPMNNSDSANQMHNKAMIIKSYFSKIPFSELFPIRGVYEWFVLLEKMLHNQEPALLSPLVMASLSNIFHDLESTEYDPTSGYEIWRVNPGSARERDIIVFLSYLDANSSFINNYGSSKPVNRNLTITRLIALKMLETMIRFYKNHLVLFTPEAFLEYIDTLTTLNIMSMIDKKTYETSTLASELSFALPERQSTGDLLLRNARNPYVSFNYDGFYPNLPYNLNAIRI